MNYINAAILFETLVTAHGQFATCAEEAVFFRSSGACLRLRAIDSGVALEITHGPTDHSEACWLVLYSDPVGPEHPSLASCIEYGMDLMLPESRQPNEEAEHGESGQPSPAALSATSPVMA